MTPTDAEARAYQLGWAAGWAAKDKEEVARQRTLADEWERSADQTMERALYGDGCGMATASALRSCASALRGKP